MEKLPAELVMHIYEFWPRYYSPASYQAAKKISDARVEFESANTTYKNRCFTWVDVFRKTTVHKLSESILLRESSPASDHLLSTMCKISKYARLEVERILKRLIALNRMRIFYYHYLLTHYEELEDQLTDANVY